MHDVLKKRVLRKLDVLPEAQLYQVLDYIEFLESRYAERSAAPSSGFQRFAERLEDGMRARSLAARTMSGTMKLVSTAGKVIDGLSGIFETAPSRPDPKRTGPGTGKLPARQSDSPQRVVGSIGPARKPEVRPGPPQRDGEAPPGSDLGEAEKAADGPAPS